MSKIAEFCDIEVYMDNHFEGSPYVSIIYLDDDVEGGINLQTGEIKGDFSKYVIPVISAWFVDNKDILLSMWGSRRIEVLPSWGE